MCRWVVGCGLDCVFLYCAVKWEEGREVGLDVFLVVDNMAGIAFGICVQEEVGE